MKSINDHPYVQKVMGEFQKLQPKKVVVLFFLKLIMSSKYKFATADCFVRFVLMLIIGTEK